MPCSTSGKAWVEPGGKIISGVFGALAGGGCGCVTSVGMGVTGTASGTCSGGISGVCSMTGGSSTTTGSASIGISSGIIAISCGMSGLFITSLLGIALPNSGSFNSVKLLLPSVLSLTDLAAILATL